MGVVADSFKLEHPCIFEGVPAVEQWQKDATVQVALGRFGGKYKKQAGYTEEGRSQMSVATGDWRAETQTMFSAIKAGIAPLARVDAEGLIARVQETMWLFGYDPKMKSTSCTPNGLPMLKTLVCGEVKLVAFEVESMVLALQAQWKVDKIGYDKIIEDVPKLSLCDLRLLRQSGVVIRSALLKPGEVVYIPAG